MLKLFKYFWLIGTLRQVAGVYRKEKGKPKPIFLSRRMIGAIFIAGSVMLARLADVEIGAKEVTQLSDYAFELIGGGYGLVMLMVGIWKREKSK